ncbi:MAG: sigma-70 family RNA polymerase sigma factor [Acidimicrobiaceae bacterium]|nr:sigma-70 family RNA polymerase sigma factor [Acidimicrobiaceae bacterium]
METIVNAKAGDKDALSRLWCILNPGLVRYLTSLGCKFSEDIASESWISLSKVLPRFQGELSSLQGLLFQIARARLYDQLRKDYRRPKQLLMVVDDQNSFRKNNYHSGPEASLDESSSQTLEWLSQIPTTQAEVVSLRVIVGLSHYEISQIIGKSEGAVRILFFRGLENLEKVVIGEKKSMLQKKFFSSA